MLAATDWNNLSRCSVLIYLPHKTRHAQPCMHHFRSTLAICQEAPSCVHPEMTNITAVAFVASWQDCQRRITMAGALQLDDGFQSRSLECSELRFGQGITLVAPALKTIANCMGDFNLKNTCACCVGEADVSEEPRVKKKSKRLEAMPDASPAPAGVPNSTGQQTEGKSQNQRLASAGHAPVDQPAAAAPSKADISRAGFISSPGTATQQTGLEAVTTSGDLVMPKKKKKKQQSLDPPSEPVRAQWPSADRGGSHQKPIKSHPEDLAHHQNSSDKAQARSARQQTSDAAHGLDANGRINSEKVRKHSKKKKPGAQAMGSNHKSSKEQH